MHTALCDRLGIEFPIFAFSHCRDVVAAVSRAGGLGVLGAVGFTPEQLEIECNWIDEHVGDKPYGVDVVIPGKYEGMGEVDPKKLEEMLRAAIPEEHRHFVEEGPRRPRRAGAARGRAGRCSELLGWTAATANPQVDVALRHPKVKLIANALGTPPADVIERIHESGRLVTALCGSAKQARAHRDAGVDIIIAQGTEGGGHTGEIGSVVLWPEVIDAVAPDAGAGRRRHRHRPADRRRAGHGRAGRVDRLALADGAGGRRAAGAARRLPRGHQQGHGALALLHRQAVPHAAQRLDRGLGGARVAEAARHAAAVHGHRPRRWRAATATPTRRRTSCSTRSARSSGR